MKVVVDTDAGLDDAVAILMAVNLLPQGSVLGVTSVFGNVDLNQANFNISKYLLQFNKIHRRYMSHVTMSCRILQVSRQPQIPIFSGARKPLISGVEKRWHVR
jgi:purine nucleosidase